MAVEITCNLEGVEEFEKAVEKLDSAMQRQIHEQLAKWAANVKDAAKQLAPVRTGYLRSSLYAEIQGWTAKIGAEASYAGFVEFGTRYMQARPYIYPALQRHLPQLEQIILEALDAAKREAGL
ncbi:hypothetical protein DRO44_01310 [Candidatus Bathyarchaeota archaeon]|nr:MAG: hypothetical protein DRO44_01310 [Candidatus Bathyarchaeota archaeon]